MWISKKKYEELEDRIEKLEREVKYFNQFNFSNLYCDVNDIKRVFEKCKAGEITYYSHFDKSVFMPSLNENEKSNIYTYIYSDFKEYRMDGLYLYDPKFTNDIDNSDIIYVTDQIKFVNKVEQHFYTIDLKNKTYIQTK